MCRSQAWDAKIVTSAWWVHAHQVRQDPGTAVTTLFLYYPTLEHARVLALQWSLLSSVLSTSMSNARLDSLLNKPVYWHAARTVGGIFRCTVLWSMNKAFKVKQAYHIPAGKGHILVTWCMYFMR